MFDTKESSWAAIMIFGSAITVCGQPAVLRPSQPAAPSGAFTEVTGESGIEQILADHYAANPKWWLSGLYLIDLDADGKLDFVTGAHGGGRPIAALNDGSGHFVLAPGYRGTEVHICGDLDEDGKVDISMNYRDGGGKWWMNQSSPGKVSLKEGVLAGGRGQARVNGLIDLDRDGKVDWIHEKPGVCWELGDGKGTFVPGGNVPSCAVRNETNVHYGDLRGNGVIDLVIHWGRYDNGKGQSRVLFNDGRLHFTDVTVEVGLSDRDGLAVKGVGDLNQDGFPDLMLLQNRRPEIYLNDGKGHFRRLDGALLGIEAARKPHYVSWGLATVTDFDNDGVADVIWNGRNFLWALRGLGGGRLKYMNRKWGINDFAAATVDDGLCFGDIDDDGDLDIIGYGLEGGNNRRQVKVYRNDLPKRNWIRVRPVGAPGNINAAGAKIRIFPARDTRDALRDEQVQIVSSQSAQSYYSYALTERHFGLDKLSAVDVVVEFYPSGKKVAIKGAKANTTIEICERSSHVSGGGN